MTKPDMLEDDNAPSEGMIMLKRALLGAGGGIVLVYTAGVLAGYSTAVIRRGSPDLDDAARIGGLALAIAVLAYAMWRLWPRGLNEPVAPRVRSARLIMIAAMALGMPLGLILAVSDGEVTGILSNDPVSPAVAVSALALWLIAGPVLSWVWWRRVDEHEAGAYRDGAFVAVHAYLFVSPAWWMATRAGWLPPQDPMLVLLAVSIVWSIVWFIRRYF